MTNKHKKAAGHVAIYAFGTIIRQLVGFIMLPIYTRYLSPADYGVIALLTLTIAVLELVMGARFAQAIPKFYFEKNSQSERGLVISTALLITTGISFLGSIALALASQPVSTLVFGIPENSIYIAIFSILLFTTAIENYGLTFIRLKDKPILFVSISLSKLVVQLTLNIVLVVYNDMGVMGVVISSVASSILFCLGMGTYIIYNSGIRYDAALGLRLIKFSWPLWLAGFAALYISSSSRYYIRIFSDLTDVGLFELATRFASLLALLVWRPFTQWWQTERFNLYNGENHNIQVFQGVFIIILSALTFAAIGISLFSDIVIRIMAAKEFHSASIAIPALALASLFYCIGLFFNFSFLATEKTLYITYLKYLSAALITIVFLITIPKYGFLGASYATLVTNVILFYITFYIAKRKFDMQIGLSIVHLMIALAVACIWVDQTWGNYQNIWMNGLSKIAITLASIVAIGLLLFCHKASRNILLPIVAKTTKTKKFTS